MTSLKNSGKYQSFSISNSTVVGVFGWMFYGLLLTAISSFGLFLLAANEIIPLDTFMTIMVIALIAYIVLTFVSVFVMSRTESKVTALIMFSLYAITLGCALSSIFVVASITEVIYALATTSVVFGIMALYGYFTKRDLTRFGSLLTMFLIGAVVMSLINGLLSFLLGPTVYTTMYWIISYVILGVMIGYVAYDVQQLKRAAQAGALHSALPIFLAFNLYVDFISIFLRILEIIMRNRD